MPPMPPMPPKPGIPPKPPGKPYAPPPPPRRAPPAFIKWPNPPSSSMFYAKNILKISFGSNGMPPPPPGIPPMLKLMPPGKPAPGPAPAPLLVISSMLMPMSCYRRLSGSESTAQASLTSLNIFSARAFYSSDSLFLSGCHLSAAFL